MIRKAIMKDIKNIYKLLQFYSDKGELLPRPLSLLYENIRNFSVYIDKESNKIIACCALQFCWEDTAEVRSLAVVPEYQRQKIGTAMVRNAICEAKSFDVPKVFTLTYKPDFFAKLGFKIVEKTELPLKIWSDCIHCVKFPDCDETAMALDNF